MVWLWLLVISHCMFAQLLPRNNKKNLENLGGMTEIMVCLHIFMAVVPKL